jgi:hypothetical protein
MSRGSPSGAPRSVHPFFVPSPALVGTVAGRLVHRVGEIVGLVGDGHQAVARGLRTVTSVDRSRSCPQECAQVGEISAPRGRRRPRVTCPGGRAGHSFDSSPPDVNPPGDQRFRRETAGKGRVWRRPASSTWARTGDDRGVDRGWIVDKRPDRCTTVESSTCRQQDTGPRPTVGQHGHWAPEQPERVGSPGSTPVMTKMR